MNPLALTYAIQLLNQLPSLIATGAQVVGQIQSARNSLELMQAENRAPTAEEWAALDAITQSLRKQLHS
jgi:hypothetical protein